MIPLPTSSFQLPLSVAAHLKACENYQDFLREVGTRRSIYRQEENVMVKSCLVVRAEMADTADRDQFDHWYATDHLPAPTMPANSPTSLATTRGKKRKFASRSTRRRSG